MHCNVGNHVSPFNSHPPRIKALPKTDCMPQLSSVVVGDDLDSHMGVGGQLAPRQGQQQPGMLDHLSGIDFNQTLVSAQLFPKLHLHYSAMHASKSMRAAAYDQLHSTAHTTMHLAHCNPLKKIFSHPEAQILLLMEASQCSRESLC